MLTTISLYTGAGGLDLGLEAVGFRTAVAVEMDEDSVRTVAENRDWKLIHRNIHHVTTDEILQTGGLKRGEADLLVGGPPCQPFSKSAFWVKGDTARLNDPRSSTLEQFLRVLREARPKAFLLENVPGLGYRGKNEGELLLQSVLEVINADSDGSLSYVGHSKVLNAAAFGVPQLRHRFFMIGHREGFDFGFPEGRFISKDSEKVEEQRQLLLREEQSGKGARSYVTAWDAIGDLEDHDEPDLGMGGQYATLLPSIPEGENYLYHTPRGGGEPLFGWRTRYWSFLLKLSKRLPSWTLTAQPGSAIGPFHWKNRRLSTREMARLQTFPEGYEFMGSRRSAQRQIGNAVPSILAATLGIEIRRQLFGHDVAEEEQKLQGMIFPPRLPVPGPEPVAPVPQEHLWRRGNHQPHPGTGHGPGAVARGSD